VIWLVVIMYWRFLLSLRDVEDLLLERGIEQPGGEPAPVVPTMRARHAAFQGMKELQKFASVHASAHNLFNLERRLIDRNLKGTTSAALAEWQRAETSSRGNDSTLTGFVEPCRLVRRRFRALRR
jgi:hypothetical protein